MEMDASAVGKALFPQKCEGKTWRSGHHGDASVQAAVVACIGCLLSAATREIQYPFAWHCESKRPQAGARCPMEVVEPMMSEEGK